ncbi:MAG: SUMF1/EgtB/PvdO family nonheme iron enzyme [Planctomycetes bacterium]|nr:SUMF1/EgtB/PvdO family nonheme iron enzyme [Planctomycetota bacterium]
MKARIAYHVLLTAAIVALGGGCGGEGAPAPPAPSAAAAVEKTTTKTGIEMVLVPAGEFIMGSDRGEPDERPAHTVRLGAFWMDTREVSQQAYQALMGKNPAKFAGPDRPVERVSWLGAVRYCNMRSLREGLPACYDPKTLACDPSADGYRLPTEAEWEYACRAGGVAAYAFGDDPAGLGKVAWFKDNAAGATHPVGQKEPNAWGLHGMHGNVAEWCEDFYAEGYDAAPGEAADPRGPPSGDERILRGGSWRSSADACRASARASEAPGFADVCFGYEAYGFRCVRRADEARPIGPSP